MPETNLTPLPPFPTREGGKRLSPIIVSGPPPSLLGKGAGGVRWYYALLLAWLSTTAMHIPDGYLSPATDLVMALLVLPFWLRGVRRLRETANARRVPVIALFAALSFVMMMLNIPLPGGTTGHAIGAVLAAIILGPETATIVISIALFIQALFFGDGGVLTLGANCFNMAVVLPYLGYAVYRAIAGGRDLGSRRHIVGAALGGWAGMTVAALIAGIEFGIQPALFHTASGAPLYGPYPLAVAVPAMVIPHLLVVGPIEGLLTALVVAYLQRANRPALAFSTTPAMTAEAGFHRGFNRLWIGVVALALAAPLGLLAPGTAWGEWNSAQHANRGLGFIPQGLGQLASLWNPPLAGYNLPALHDPTLGYALSALLGVSLFAFIAWLFSKLRI